MRFEIFVSISYGTCLALAVTASVDSTILTVMMFPYIRLPSLIPVALSLWRTAKFWNVPSVVVSSSTITVALRTIATLSGVTSPRTLSESAGPGKGMRSEISFGKPSWRATMRTSGLKSSFNGSRIL